MSEMQFPVEISAPDISAYQHGNTGIDYISQFDSGQAGPHVMISAVVHGNELCGAIALDWLLREGIRPRLGKLTLAFMNVTAFERFDAHQPSASRYVDEDFNRLWSRSVLDSDRDSCELRRAREVRPLVDAVDVLLDIHSMQQGKTALTLCGPLEKGRRLAMTLGSPAHIVADEGHAAGKRMRDYAGFGDPDSSKNSLLVECGQHWKKTTVDIAKDQCVRFLNQHDMLDPEFAHAHLQTRFSSAQKIIEVTGPITIKTDAFRFTDDFHGLDVIAKAGTLIGFDGAEEIRTPYDDCVLIMPSLRRRKGESAVRLGRFVATSAGLESGTQTSLSPTEKHPLQR